MVEGMVKGAAKTQPLCTEIKAAGITIAGEMNSRTENTTTQDSRTTTV